MSTCDLCHDEDNTSWYRKYRLCSRCKTGLQYQDSLSAEEMRKEQESIARHVAEQEERGLDVTLAETLAAEQEADERLVQFTPEELAAESLAIARYVNKRTAELEAQEPIRLGWCSARDYRLWHVYLADCGHVVPRPQPTTHAWCTSCDPDKMRPQSVLRELFYRAGEGA